jgi:hypothetical protein
VLLASVYLLVLVVDMPACRHSVVCLVLEKHSLQLYCTLLDLLKEYVIAMHPLVPL